MEKDNLENIYNLSRKDILLISIMNIIIMSILIWVININIQIIGLSVVNLNFPELIFLWNLIFAIISGCGMYIMFQIGKFKNGN